MSSQPFIPSLNQVRDWSQEQMLEHRITKVWYHKDYFINVLSFEFKDGTRSPPAKASKHHATNYFLWPNRIIKQDPDGKKRELNPIRKFSFLSDALLWKFTLDDKDDSPLLCSAAAEVIGKKGLLMNAPMFKNVRDLKEKEQEKEE